MSRRHPAAVADPEPRTAPAIDQTVFQREHPFRRHRDRSISGLPVRRKRSGKRNDDRFPSVIHTFSGFIPESRHAQIIHDEFSRSFFPSSAEAKLKRRVLRTVKFRDFDRFLKPGPCFRRWQIDPNSRLLPQRRFLRNQRLAVPDKIIDRKSAFRPAIEEFHPDRRDTGTWDLRRKELRSAGLRLLIKSQRTVSAVRAINDPSDRARTAAETGAVPRFSERLFK